ncbi:hypothetical protein V1264_001810 [Littorina saxatilis]
MELFHLSVFSVVIFLFHAAKKTSSATASSVTCDFEGGMCGWQATPTTGYTFHLHNGSTPDRTSGPDRDHTLQGDDATAGHYVYSSGWDARDIRQVAKLLSPNFTATEPSTLSVWYQMNGNGIGTLTLNLYHWARIQPSSLLWTVSGRQGLGWHKREVVLPTGQWQVEFQSTIKHNYGSDIALDDIQLVPNSQITTSKLPSSIRTTMTSTKTTMTTTTPPGKSTSPILTPTTSLSTRKMTSPGTRIPSSHSSVAALRSTVNRASESTLTTTMLPSRTRTPATQSGQTTSQSTAAETPRSTVATKPSTARSEPTSQSTPMTSTSIGPVTSKSTTTKVHPTRTSSRSSSPATSASLRTSTSSSTTATKVTSKMTSATTSSPTTPSSTTTKVTSKMTSATTSSPTTLSSTTTKVTSKMTSATTSSPTTPPSTTTKVTSKMTSATTMSSSTSRMASEGRTTPPPSSTLYTQKTPTTKPSLSQDTPQPPTSATKKPPITPSSTDEPNTKPGTEEPAVVTPKKDTSTVSTPAQPKSTKKHQGFSDASSSSDKLSSRNKNIIIGVTVGVIVVAMVAIGATYARVRNGKTGQRLGSLYYDDTHDKGQNGIALKTVNITM